MSGEVKDWLFKWLAKQAKPAPAFNIQPMSGTWFSLINKNKIEFNFQVSFIRHC